MKPIGPLMREHRLIERMVTLLNNQLEFMNETNRVDIPFLMVAVDFFRMYSDKTHHGKEEEILFRGLAQKQLTPEHLRIMNELIEEHTFARLTVTHLMVAREKHIQGDEKAIQDIIFSSKELVKFYPAHILKEDKHFFYPCMEYFTAREQNEMLDKFWEFDRTLIHLKYQNVVENIETKHYSL